MRQTRICEHLCLRCRHAPTIFDLPAAIRRRIYVAAGLVVDDCVVLQRRAGRWPRHALPDLRLTRRLLRTSRAVRVDVLTLLMAENRVVVPHEAVDAGLRFLRRLPPASCAALRDLTVGLRVARGVPPPVPQRAGGFARPPAVPRRPLHRDTLAAWLAAASHVLAHVPPGRLRLRLTCDADGAAAAGADKTGAVLRPLRRAAPGLLARCELRLHSEHRAELAALAQDVALRAEGRAPHLRAGRPFRFFALPAELRRRILGRTDLATPCSEIRWRPGQGFCASFRLGEGHATACPCERSFCRRDQSAFSSLCRCWFPPGALMLVSHGFYREAVAVLYSCNRVVVTVPSLCDTFSFLAAHRVWPDALSHLRTLDLVVFQPVAADAGPLPGWVDAVRHLATHANAPGLTLLFHASLTGLGIAGDDPRPSTEELNATNPLCGLLTNLRELRALRTLRRLALCFEWRWHWSSPGFARSVRGDGFARERDATAHAWVEHLEQEMEVLVMGKDYLDRVWRVLAVETRISPSHWQRREWGRADIMQFPG